MMPRHILSTGQFSREYVEKLFHRAQDIESSMLDPDGRRALRTKLYGHLMFSLFYEPSTRTRLSFESAAFHLGMSVKGTDNAREFSSAIKGESIEDSIKVLCDYYPSVIVMRHHESGAAERAAKVSSVPIINGGDGNNEHPTQTLLDLYTIQQELGLIDGIRVLMGGDLANGRTVRSLAKMLAKFDGVEITFVSPPELRVRSDVKKFLEHHGVAFQELNELNPAILQTTNVLYWTRVQKERFEQMFLERGALKDEATRKGEELYMQVYDQFVITTETMKLLPENSILMHPLPRVNEIHEGVDKDPRAAYFRQSANGLPIRMALLEKIILG